MAKILKTANEMYHQFNRHQQPVLFLNIEMPSEMVDINVTPDKRKILMHMEAELVDIIKASLNAMYEPAYGTYNTAKFQGMFNFTTMISNERLEKDDCCINY